MKKYIISFLLVGLLASLLISGCGQEPSEPASMPVAPTSSVPLTEDSLLNSNTDELLIPSLPPLPTLAIPEKHSPAPQPSLSIAYLGPDQNLWLWAEGETARRLTDSEDVRSVFIHPDGKIVAFTRATGLGGSSLWVVRSDGSDLRAMVQVADFEAMPTDNLFVKPVLSSVGWVPQSHSLLFNTRTATYPSDLWLTNAETGGFSNLFKESMGGEFSVSPDGSQIALITPQRICLVLADGTIRRRLLNYEIVATGSSEPYLVQLYWSADSSFMRVAVPSPDRIAENASATIYHIVTSLTPETRQLGSIFTAPSNLYPVFSPNLEHIAYYQQANPAQESSRTLHIASADGTGDKEITSALLLDFKAWSPDSKHFLYSTGQERTLRSAELQSSTAGTPIDHSAGTWEAQWVDSNRFLFAAGSDLRLSQIDGSVVWMEKIQQGNHTFDFTH